MTNKYSIKNAQNKLSKEQLLLEITQLNSMTQIAEKYNMPHQVMPSLIWSYNIFSTNEEFNYYKKLSHFSKYNKEHLITKEELLDYMNNTQYTWKDITNITGLRRDTLKFLCSIYNISSTSREETIKRQMIKIYSNSNNKNNWSSGKTIKGHKEIKMHNANLPNYISKNKMEENAYQILKKYYSNKIIREYYNPKEYPWNCDLYLPDKNLYIELNFHYTHGNHPYTGSEEDIKIYNSKKGRFKEELKAVWIDGDTKKRNTAKKHNLNYLEFYSLNDFETYCKNNLIS